MKPVGVLLKTIKMMFLDHQWLVRGGLGLSLNVNLIFLPWVSEYSRTLLKLLCFPGVESGSGEEQVQVMTFLKPTANGM